MATFTAAEGAIKLEKLISRDAPHREYQETVKDAKFWRSIRGGEIKELILQYKARESDTQKDQRVAITNQPATEAYTRATANMERLDNPDGLIREIGYTETKDEALKQLLQRVIRFNGDKSMDQFILDGFRLNNTVDPNSFLYIGFTGRRDGAAWKEKPLPMPETIPCEEVYDRERINGEYVSITRLKTLSSKNEKGESIDYRRYTMYGQGWIIQATEVTPVSPPNQGNEVKEVRIGSNNTMKSYAFETFDLGKNMEGITPFIEWGYLNLTDDDTFDSILAPVKSRFMDLINTTSEYALSKALHVFLQKYQFVRECRNVSKEGGRCEHGTMSVTRTPCRKCGGTGKEVMTSVQDVIQFTLPESKDEYFPLSEMVHYPTIPFEIVKHLHDEIPELHSEIEKTLWGMNIASPPNGDTLAPTTATEIIGRYDTVYKRLSRMARHIERIWVKCLDLTARYAEINEGLKYRYQYPATFQMESLQELFVLLSDAKKSGVPYSVINAIERQIMKKQGQISPEVLQWFDASNEFRPFKSKSAADIAALLSAMPDNAYYKVLWTYFDEIFETIKNENPEFIRLPFVDKKAVLDDVVAGFVIEVEKAMPQAAPSIDSIKRTPA